VIVRRGSGHDPFVMGKSPPRDGPNTDASRVPPSPIRALVENHFDFIWRLLRRQGLGPPDADDAAQQVFMIATQKLHSIAPGSERSFLYGTAVRVAANARRAASRRREVAEEGLDSKATHASPPDEQAELGRAWALLDELFAQLPDELGRVLALSEIEQVEVSEIAALEQIPVGTAASRLRRARAAFRELLGAVEHRNPFKKEVP
jgi:RNA polymerase sigma-70 factor, ECF subfamily